MSQDISKPYFEYNYFIKLLNLFEEFMSNPHSSGTPNCMLIYGEPGTGKSALAKKFLDKHPRIENEEQTLIPVFYFQLMGEKTVKDLAINLLSALGAPPSNRRSTASYLLTLFKKNCKATGVQFIFIDETHNLIEERSDSAIKVIAQQFKSLIDDLGVPIIFMGNTISKSLLQKNSELASRIPYRYCLKHFRVKNKDSFDDYCRFLDDFANHYGFSESVDLEDYENLYRIFAFTAGELRQTEFLVERAYKLATKSSEPITLNTFAQVLSDFGFSKDTNPFLQPLKELVLILLS